jgi:hypothetical protein
MAANLGYISRLGKISTVGSREWASDFISNVYSPLTHAHKSLSASIQDNLTYEQGLVAYNTIQKLKPVYEEMLSDPVKLDAVSMNTNMSANSLKWVLSNVENGLSQWAKFQVEYFKKNPQRATDEALDVTKKSKPRIPQAVKETIPLNEDNDLDTSSESKIPWLPIGIGIAAIGAGLMMGG